MTVRELIKQLRKMPQDARVVVCDHDHDDESGQHNGPPYRVDEASPAMRRQHGYGVVIHL